MLCWLILFLVFRVVGDFDVFFFSGGEGDGFAEEFLEAGFDLGFVLGFHLEEEGGLVGVFDVGDGEEVLGIEEVEDFSGILGGLAEGGEGEEFFLGDAGLLDGFADAFSVGADEAAGAEFDAAEVAGDDGEDVVELFFAEDFEHGDASGAGGFAVVA